MSKPKCERCGEGVAMVSLLNLQRRRIERLCAKCIPLALVDYATANDAIEEHVGKLLSHVDLGKPN